MNIDEIKLSKLDSKKDIDLKNEINRRFGQVGNQLITDDERENLSHQSNTNTGDQAISIVGQVITLDKNGGSVTIPPAVKGPAWDTALPTMTDYVEYPYKGANNTLISGISWYNGDSAQKYGGVVYRIPFQSLTNYNTKDEIAGSISFFNAGYNAIADSTTIKLINNAVKSIKLIGAWVASDYYTIRLISRNHVTNKYQLIIQNMNALGIVGDYGGYAYDSGAMVVTEAGIGKLTTFLSTLVSGRQVLITVDFNLLTDGTQYNCTANNNYTVKPENIVKYGDDLATVIGALQTQDTALIAKDVVLQYNDFFWNAKFGKIGVPTLCTSVLASFRGLALLGTWDTSEEYAIDSLCYNHATNKYRLIIAKLPNKSTGVWTSVDWAYDSGVVDFTVSATVPTLIKFPLVNGKQVVAIIDYSTLVDGTLYGVSTGMNWVIRNECINNNIVTDNANYFKGTKLTFDYTEAELLSTSNSLKGSNDNKYKRVLPLLGGNKRGMVVMRTDDSTFNDNYKAIYERFNAITSWAVNPTVAAQNNILELQRDGHEVADHTPNHNSDYFTIPTGYETEFDAFRGHGLDSISGTTAYLTRKFLNGATDVTATVDPATDLATYKIGATNGYTLAVGTNRITGDFSSLMSSKFFFLFVDNANGTKIRWATVNMTTLTNTYADITMPDGAAINAPANETLSMYAVPVGAQYCTLTDEATYVLLLAGQKWFANLGLKPPRVWAQPGSLSSRVTSASLETALTKLGMVFGTVLYEWDLPLTYNHVRTNPRSAYLYTNGLDFGDKTLNYLQTAKNLIADTIAKHQLCTTLTHISVSSVYFEGLNTAEKTNNHNKFITDLVKWLYSNKIPVIGFEEAITLLRASINESINIMPNLISDLAGQSKPDGYTLGSGATWTLNDGVPEDNTHCISRTATGTMFTITNLGGLEKGEMNFTCWIKGTATDTISIQFGAIQTTVFTIATTGWNKFNVSLIVPYTTNFLDITCTSTVTGTRFIGISGMKLKV